ncbi:MAG: hypothetical protein NTX40_09415 [Planctomycetota bacterium]|nr:hypothetical protein [Planctomycetota bacterium]
MASLMSNKEFLSAVQEFMAIQAVTVSTVRGLRKGTLKKIHAYLGRLRLGRLVGMNGAEYVRWLDAKTRDLQRKLRGRNKRWGLARKSMNLFMRQCLYNTYLSRRFRLARFQKQMEIPLDSRVARELGKDARKRKLKLPPWPGLIGLDEDGETSRKFQDYAKDLAPRKGLPARVFLDNYLWLKYRKGGAGRASHRS